MKRPKKVIWKFVQRQAFKKDELLVLEIFVQKCIYRFPLNRCSISTASNSALKLPAPKP